MHDSEQDRLIYRYLVDVTGALRSRPQDERRRLVGELVEEIQAARDDLTGGGTPQEVRTLLDDLGRPDEIAARFTGANIAASNRRAARLQRWRDTAALILLLLGGVAGFVLAGGVVVPLVGWFVGVALLWGSETWTRNEKLLGTLVIPGGLLPLVVAAVAGSGSGGESCVGSFAPVAGTSGPMSCTGDESPLPGPLAIVIVAALLILPTVTVGYLHGRRQRAGSSAHRKSVPDGASA